MPQQTALATRDEESRIFGPVHVTPVFNVDPSAALFPRIRVDDEPWLLAAHPRRPRSPETTATSIASPDVLGRWLTRLLGAMNQTPIGEDFLGGLTELQVVPLSTSVAELVGDFQSQTSEKPAAFPAKRALSAISDLQGWLAVGSDQVASLAGYSSRSMKNWRAGMAPYPATVRRLFDLHALVGSLIRVMGIEGARLWLAEVSRGGVRRRELLGNDDGLRSVISEASAYLFTSPVSAPIHALDFEEEPETRVRQRPELFTGPVRRARRR